MIGQFLGRASRNAAHSKAPRQIELRERVPDPRARSGDENCPHLRLSEFSRVIAAIDIENSASDVCGPWSEEINNAVDHFLWTREALHCCYIDLSLRAFRICGQSLGRVHSPENWPGRNGVHAHREPTVMVGRVFDRGYLRKKVQRGLAGDISRLMGDGETSGAGRHIHDSAAGCPANKFDLATQTVEWPAAIHLNEPIPVARIRAPDRAVRAGDASVVDREMQFVSLRESIEGVADASRVSDVAFDEMDIIAEGTSRGFALLSLASHDHDTTL
nr:hypothetical protein [Methylosinus sp. RM1]